MTASQQSGFLLLHARGLLAALVLGAVATSACASDRSPIVAADAGSGGGGEGGGGGGAGGGGAGGGGGGSGAVDAGTVGHSATPLPTGTFIFRRQTNGPNALTTHSLVAYDAATRQERLVTDLVDGGDGTEVTGHAVSPDRKSVTFTAFFRPMPADYAGGKATPSVWVVDADGQVFNRVSPPVFSSDTGGSSCTGNADCAPDLTCISDECRKALQVGVVANPAFTADGSQLMFQIGNYFSAPGGQLEGGEQPWIVSAAGGFPTPAVQVEGCTVVTTVAPDPGGMGFLANHAVCLSPAHDGLYFHPFAGGDLIEVASPKLNGVDPGLDPPSWLADGSGFVFVGTTAATVGGQATQATLGILVQVSDHSLHAIATPDTADQRIRSIAIAPDGKFFAYCLNSGSANDIVVVDVRTTPAVTFAATTDGKSCEPRF